MDLNMNSTRINQRTNVQKHQEKIEISPKMSTFCDQNVTFWRRSCIQPTVPWTEFSRNFLKTFHELATSSNGTGFSNDDQNILPNFENGTENTGFQFWDPFCAFSIFSKK